MKLLFLTTEWPFKNQPYRAPFVPTFTNKFTLNIETVVLPLPLRKNPWNLIRYRQLISNEFFKHNCTHIHCYSLRALLLVKPKRFPVSASAIGSDVMGVVNQKGHYTRIGEWAFLAVKEKLKHLKGLRYVSEPLLKVLQQKVNSLPPTIAIPDGIDLNFFPVLDRREACRQLGWDQDAIHVFFPGNIERGVKNFGLAKWLIKSVQSTLPVFLHTFPGVSHDQMNLYYQASDLALFTSIHEGSSNSLKEAIATHTPVLTTNVGDAEHWLNEGAMGDFITSETTGDEMANLIKYYSRLKREGHQNPPHILEEMDVQNTTKRFADFLKEIDSNN